MLMIRYLNLISVQSWTYLYSFPFLLPKPEYQLEENLIKNVAFSALWKNVTLSQVLLRRKIVLCDDATRL